MLPNREYINNSSSAFFSYRLDQAGFDFIWHYHPEIEINFIIRGFGKRLVGDHVDEFRDGEISIFGSNLPHTYVSQQSERGIECYGIQFMPSLFPPSLLEKEEFAIINALIDRSRRGIVFKSKINRQLINLVLDVHRSHGMNRYVSLLKLLETLGKKNKYKLLASPGYSATNSLSGHNRFDQACKYIHNHYQRGITLQEMADITNLSPTSFCRYFKKQTGKTFINYVNDWKIGKACRMLIQSNTPIAQIAFESGFNNVVHFNRMFKEKKKVSPGKYRREYTSVV